MQTIDCARVRIIIIVTITTMDGNWRHTQKKKEKDMRTRIAILRLISEFCNMFFCISAIQLKFSIHFMRCDTLPLPPFYSTMMVFHVDDDDEDGLPRMRLFFYFLIL